MYDIMIACGIVVVIICTHVCVLVAPTHIALWQQKNACCYLHTLNEQHASAIIERMCYC
jgi:hypothetical protein